MSSLSTTFMAQVDLPSSRNILDHVTPGTEEAWDVLHSMKFVHLILNLLPEIPETEYSKDDFGTILSRIYSLNISKVVMTERILAVLYGYINLVKHANSIEPTPFHMVVLKDYQWCMDCLQDTYRSKRTTYRKRVLDSWIESGRQLNLQPSLYRTGEAQALFRPSHWRGCNYGRCVCNDVPPCHKMKVCRGCWRVRYCGVKCQKRYASIFPLFHHIYILSNVSA